MDRLLELLGIVTDPEALAALNDDEVQAVLDEIRELSLTVLEGEPTDDDLATLERVETEAIPAITALQATRAETAAQEAEAAAQAEAERAERLARLRTSLSGPPEGEGEGEGETVEDPSAGGTGETVPEPVTAGAGHHSPARTNARGPALGIRPNPLAPKVRQPAGQLDLENLPIVASANLPNVPAGARLDTPIKLAKAFMAAYDASKGYKGGSTKVPVCRIGFDDPGELYGQDRVLSPSDPEGNQRKIEAVTSLKAITAAGGVCAPLNVSYDIPSLGTDARPFRDEAMARFGAERGGARTFPPPLLDDMSGAITLWTMANDANPTNPAKKACLTLTCPDPTQDIVEAIVRCVQVGNFRSRYFPEQVASWIEKVGIAHARTAENQLMTQVGNQSTKVTVGQNAGATLDLLTGLDRMIAGYESRFRTGDAHPPLRLSLPLWVTDMVRADITRQPRTAGTLDEQYAFQDAQLERWLTAKGMNVTWYLDGEAGQIFGKQFDGPAPSWPAFAVGYLYAEGEWLFLDGGTIDLGIVRDSTLNSTNDYQMFAESMEGAHFHGYQSYRMAFYLCPNGVMSAPQALSVCSDGS